MPADPPPKVLTTSILRISFQGLVGSTSIVNVQWYCPRSPGSFIPNVLGLDTVALNAANLYGDDVVANLHDSYNMQLCTVALYGSPYKWLHGTPARWSMKVQATYQFKITGTGGRSGEKLPDFAVYRPYKVTGLAGRSYRGYAMFSPLLEEDTTGNDFTNAFLNLAGPGGKMKTWMGKSLFAGDLTQELQPVLFRQKEYLLPEPVGPAPTTSPVTPSAWMYPFDPVNVNNEVCILRRRRLRVGT